MNTTTRPPDLTVSPHRRPDYLASQFPELGTRPLSNRDFFTAEYYEREKERIFKKCWLRIARTAELSRPGDYVIRELECADTSLLIVRGQDDRIRAFHNVCSHRNNRVAYHPQGNTRTFVCRFHSWAYDTQGALVNVPEREIFADLDPCDHGLTQVACEVWEGFVFVNLDPNPAQTLREYLGEEIWHGFNGYLAGRAHVMTISTVVKTNWKIMLDAFVETYHFSTVHAPTAGSIATTPANPNGYMDLPRFYGPHRIITALSNLDHTPTFCEALARRYSGNMTLAPDGETQKLLPEFVNPGRFRDWVSDILILFPMANIHPTPGFTLIQNYWPINHETTRWEVMMLAPPPQNATQELVLEYNRVYLRDTIREDILNVEWQQSNMRSGAKPVQLLADQEIMIRHAYKTVADYVRYGY